MKSLSEGERLVTDLCRRYRFRLHKRMMSRKWSSLIDILDEFRSVKSFRFREKYCQPTIPWQIIISYCINCMCIRVTQELTQRMHEGKKIPQLWVRYTYSTFSHLFLRRKPQIVSGTFYRRICCFNSRGWYFAMFHTRDDSSFNKGTMWFSFDHFEDTRDNWFNWSDMS